MNKSGWSIAVVAGIVVALLAWRVLHHTGQIGWELLFGWRSFLDRVVPQLTFRWDGWLVFAVALLAVAGISHYLFSWYYRETSPHDQPARAWKLGWTLAAVALIVVMFAAGIAMIGVVHQVAWLAHGEEPWFSEQPDLRGVSSEDNLKAQAHAANNYHDTYRRWPNAEPDTPGHAPQSWVTEMLPFLNYELPELTYIPERPWDDPVNAACFRAPLIELLNPELNAPSVSDDGFGLNHYAGNAQVFAAPEGSALATSRGGSNTLLIGEVNAQFVPWGQPGTNLRDPSHGMSGSSGFGNATQTGALFVMADGSVRFFPAGTDPQVIAQLSRPD